MLYHSYQVTSIGTKFGLRINKKLVSESFFNEHLIRISMKRRKDGCAVLQHSLTVYKAALHRYFGRAPPSFFTSKFVNSGWMPIHS